MDDEREKLVEAQAEANRQWEKAHHEIAEADRLAAEADRQLREYDERRGREEG